MPEEDQMTTEKKANKRAAETGSGQGSISNADGPATGAGSAPSAEPRHDNQRTDAGAGSAKTAHNRPGHKT
jgi:hypothetical protein